MSMLSSALTLVTSFQDADPMGIIYHGNYFRYFEEARRLLMDQLGYSYLEMKDSGYMYPIVETKVRYIQPIRFQQEIRVTAEVAEWQNRIRVNYVIYDAQTGQRLTKAYTIQVAVRLDNGELCLVIPDIFMEKYNACLLQSEVDRES